LAKHADVVLFTSRTHKEGGLYGEAVTAKWGQILVMDVLYAAYAARHFDETLTHLADTYSTAIETSRTKKK
jgi:DNA-binding MurR/RpiR family transcriptional regulator